MLGELGASIYFQKGLKEKEKQKVTGPLAGKDQTDQGRINQDWQDSHKPITTSKKQKGSVR